MRILFVGDVYGRPGRRALKSHLAAFKESESIDFCIVNGENAASGKGITPSTAGDIFAAGADCITLGNHAWDRKEILSIAEQERRIVRPANWPPGAPGYGYAEFATRSGNRVNVCQLQGRVFLPPFDCPFRGFDALLAEHQPKGPLIVDFHAEATSEKIAFGWYADGRATAVIGTHTHVPTADERVLPKGTAYITDAGMSGSHDSVIGAEKDAIVKRFLTLLPSRNDVAENDVRIRGVIVDADPSTGRAAGIQRFVIEVADEEERD